MRLAGTRTCAPICETGSGYSGNGPGRTGRRLRRLRLQRVKMELWDDEGVVDETVATESPPLHKSCAWRAPLFLRFTKRDNICTFVLRDRWHRLFRRDGRIPVIIIQEILQSDTLYDVYLPGHFVIHDWNYVQLYIELSISQIRTQKSFMKSTSLY